MYGPYTCTFDERVLHDMVHINSVCTTPYWKSHTVMARIFCVLQYFSLFNQIILYYLDFCCIECFFFLSLSCDLRYFLFEQPNISDSILRKVLAPEANNLAKKSKQVKTYKTEGNLCCFHVGFKLSFPTLFYTQIQHGLYFINLFIQFVSTSIL